MNRILSIVSVFLLMIASLMMLASCVKGEGEQEEEEEEGQEEEEEYGEQEEEEEWVGRLPIYKVGDKWVWRYMVNDITTIRTEEIIADEIVEGRDCYVINVSFNPNISYAQGSVNGMITSMTYWLDKATAFYIVKMELSVTSNGKESIVTEIYSYNPWLSLFPLEVGEGVEMEKRVTLYSDGIQMGEPSITTENYFTESREDINVTAGSFDCWKIVVFDGEDNIIQTVWYSDRYKSRVRITDESGSLMELQLYSVQ